jgi:hypothetical protein
MTTWKSQLFHICETIDYGESRKAMDHYVEASQLNDPQKAWDNCEDSVLMMKIIESLLFDDNDKGHLALLRCLSEIVEVVNSADIMHDYSENVEYAAETKAHLLATLLRVMSGDTCLARNVLSEVLFLFRDTGSRDRERKQDIHQTIIIRKYFPKHPVVAFA